MGIYDREYYRSEGPSYLDSMWPEGRICRWLIGLNILLFIAQLVTRSVQDPNGAVTRWLVLDTEAVQHGEIWRLLTYAFLHDPDSLMHILFNMLFLWWFGSDIESIYGPREFLSFYLLTALLGGVAFQVSAMTQGGAQYCLGASGAVTAVLVLAACHFPTRTILIFFVIPAPLWLFVLFQVAQDSYFWLTQRQTGVAVVVHLAGAAFAYPYYKSQWRLSGWLPELRRRWRQRNRPSLRLYRPADDKEPVSVGAATGQSEMDEHFEAKVDAVLEKVAKVGQAGLTDTERKILLQASEIYKRKRT